MVVTISGATRRAVTDASGRFSIPGVPTGARTVSASRPGYAGTAGVTVAAGQTAEVTIRVRASSVQPQGVVAVGYGTLRRRDVTGAVSSVNTELLQRTPVTSLDQVLQGAAAGVQVSAASNTPGGGISIRVRGTSSITGNSEPLYVIDGFPIENDPEAVRP
ncbi:MAG TPA: TonB-dependent receptor plug domain-containing protein [Longimicrobium sp.]|nr:TonB-dependent receptor plug domain-containing protein [Longimicrobium sp.]